MRDNLNRLRQNEQLLKLKFEDLEESIEVVI